MAGKRIRDSQRQKVYDCEHMVFDGTLARDQPYQTPPDYKTLAECQRFVDYVTDSDTWKKVLGIHTDAPVKVLDGRGRRRGGATAALNEIAVPRFARRRFYLLHELAHIAAEYRHGRAYIDGEWWWLATSPIAAHGPEYTSVYLALVRAILGEEAYAALLSEFENRRVKVASLDVAVSPELAQEVSVPDPAPLRVVTDTETRRCVVCGMQLASVSRPRKFCSDRCRWIYHNRQRHERTAEDRQKVCEVCGAPFMAKNSRAKTCSAACKQKAYRKRTKTQ